MTKRMLIDATHAEETRVAVVDGNRLVNYDYESKVRKQLKGTIFLAKVTRVEPSLQAAFVNFGGNRHGFLPFAEIHPDYYRIPIADREALLAEQQAELEARLREEEEAERAEEEAAARAAGLKDAAQEDGGADDGFAGHADEDEDDEEDDVIEIVGGDTGADDLHDDEQDEQDEQDLSASEDDVSDAPVRRAAAQPPVEILADLPDPQEEVSFEAQDAYSDSYGESDAYDDEDEDEVNGNIADTASVMAMDEEDGEDDGEQPLSNESGIESELRGQRNRGQRGGRNRGGRGRNGRQQRGGRSGGRTGGRARYAEAQSREVDIIGGDDPEGERPIRPMNRRNYKIQEVLKRGQIMLVQVSKEERGNKGAAVTTYLSLPGRYCVLMPNSPRGGGVSRKIANFKERRRMRDLLAELQVPQGMSVIMRTAGMERTKAEIKRDLDYLMRLWDEIRETTLQSSAPALIHEEGSLVRRSIRDIYAKDIEDIVVAGDGAYKTARDFMKVMIPSHLRRVKQYKDEKVPLFHRYQVEGQIREMSEPVATLKSGGYLVINPTEALVSIDVNSGRSTKERHIEETALKTNLEAADEVARQLRLRDLGGLVVIDFIDMEDRRNNRRVEQRLKDALSSDRARIQIGRISSFGLLELSRQRLNPSLTEAQFEKCPHCAGSGHVRTIDSAAIAALRALEEECIRGRGNQITLTISNDVAIYILNHKRDMVADIERRYECQVMIRVEEMSTPVGFRVDAAKGAALARGADDDGAHEDDHADFDEAEEAEKSEARSNDSGEEGDEDRPGRRRRGRRGGRRRRRDQADMQDDMTDGSDQDDQGGEDGDYASSATDENGDEHGGEDAREKGARRSRGRRGGRNRRRRQDGEDAGQETGYDLSVSPSGDNQDVAPAPEQDTRERGNRRGRSRSTRDAAQTAPSESADAVPAPAPAPAPAQEIANVAVNPSNDVEAPARSYEKINETGGKKKKGWWNRLVE